MFETSFTDVYGNELMNALVEITQANYNSSHNIEEYSENQQRIENEDRRLTYSARYWISQAAKDAGAYPILFVPWPDLPLTKSYTSDPDLTDLLDLARNHFVTEVAPNMTMVGASGVGSSSGSNC